MIDTLTITIEIDGIGAVTFERSRRAKRVVVSIRPFKGIRVAVPHGVSFKKAEEFVYSKIDWIKKHLTKIKRQESDYTANSAVFETIDREEARAKLSRRLRQLADKYGFGYNRAFFRSQKTRWGSCSRKNNISLNMKLVKLPDELIDYVILHELVHTRKKNHSKAFWAELDKLVGNGKQLASKLKDYSIRLF